MADYFYLILQIKLLVTKDQQLIGKFIYPELDKDLKELSSKENSGYFFINLSGSRMLVCFSVMEDYGWKMISIIPFKNLTTRISQTTIYIIMIIVISIFIAILISYMVTRSVYIPISLVNETFKYLGKGDFSKKLNIKYNDEMSKFSYSFNKMIDDMQNLIEEVYITKYQKLDSDFKALQAQINPHFLYNTLESINALALIKQEYEISEMIRGLASVFRYSIKNNERSILLKDEIEHVRLYILLQALRYEDKIKIEYDIPENLLQAKVLKFILQPVVENAIIHGFEKTNKKGLIVIEANSFERFLQISIKDNGQGIAENELDEIKLKLESNIKDENDLNHKMNSIGLLNINSRIKLQFGEEYGIRVESLKGLGTVVSIKIPLEF